MSYFGLLAMSMGYLERIKLSKVQANGYITGVFSSQYGFDYF